MARAQGNPQRLHSGKEEADSTVQLRHEHEATLQQDPQNATMSAHQSPEQAQIDLEVNSLPQISRGDMSELCKTESHPSEDALNRTVGSWSLNHPPSSPPPPSKIEPPSAEGKPRIEDTSLPESGPNGHVTGSQPQSWDKQEDKVSQNLSGARRTSIQRGERSPSDLNVHTPPPSNPPEHDLGSPMRSIPGSGRQRAQSGSQASPSLQQWLMFMDRHNQVMEQRVRARDKRRALRYQQSSLRSLAKSFAQQIRAWRAGDAAPLEDLLEGSSALSAALEKLDDVLLELENADDLLVKEEWALRGLVSGLFEERANDTYAMLKTVGMDFRDGSSGDEDSRSQFFPDSAAPANPEVAEYLAKVTLINELEGQLLDVQRKRAALMEEEILKPQSRLSFDDDPLRVLDEYDQKYDDLSQQLQGLRAGLEQVRSRSPLAEPPPKTTSQSPQNRNLTGPSVELTRILLLEDAEAVLPLADELPQRDGLAPDKTELVNYWLLRQMRRSKSEVMRYSSYLSDEVLQLPELQIKELMLQQWFADGSSVTNQPVSSVRPNATNHRSMQANAGETQDLSTKSEPRGSRGFMEESFRQQQVGPRARRVIHNRGPSLTDRSTAYP